MSIADRRREAGLTQAQLAELMKCSVSAIKAYENGRRRPSRLAFTALYRALNLTAEDIAALYSEVRDEA